MRQQLLTIPPSQPITIATACGLITIRRGEGRWRLVLEMPESFRAFKGEQGKQRALEGSTLLREEDGKVKPAYRLLVPNVDAEGSIVGASEPTTLKVESKRKVGAS